MTEAEGSASSSLRVLVLDSSDLVHWGFRAVLSSERWVELLVTARTGAEALLFGRRYRPHVAVVGADPTDESAAFLCEHLPRESPETRILLTTSGRSPGSVAKQLGAAGVVPRTWDGRSIAEATRLVAFGNEFFAAGPGQPPDFAHLLSPRERTVLALVADGATNHEIAVGLGLSYNTVKDYVSGVYRKLGARNRAGAVLRAHRLGLLS